MAKKCIICAKPFTPKFKTTERYCSNLDCKIKYAMQVASKQKLLKEKKVKQDWNKEKLQIKEKLKTLSEWKNDLQREINAIIREIDKGHGCIATKSHQGQQHAGHYISVGSNETLRFHLENIWLQSMHSNSWKGGDTIRYQDGIVDLYGIEYLNHLNSLKSIETIKLSIGDIKEKIPIARGILKWIKLQSRKFTTQERVILRKKFNQEIGIYK